MRLREERTTPPTGEEKAVRIHADERRTAYCDLFDTPGDVNLFVIQPGQRTCWHRHQKQTDQFRVIRGSLRIGWIATEWNGAPIPLEPHYITLSDPTETVRIFPTYWHGYENVTDGPAYLLMYLDQKYDPTDEERMSEDVVPWWRPSPKKPYPIPPPDSGDRYP